METAVQDLETRTKNTPTKGQIAAAVLVPGYIAYKAATVAMHNREDPCPLRVLDRMELVSWGVLLDCPKAIAWVYAIGAIYDLFS